jgi:four helix bundle protein
MVFTNNEQRATNNDMRSHKDLDVWRAAIDLARDIYELTRTYPKDEQYGMVSQMRRSAVSFASNIAEGAARQSKKEFIQFLYVAVGSASELDTQIEISKVAKLVDAKRLDAVQTQLTRVIMMLRGLIRALKAPTE